MANSPCHQLALDLKAAIDARLLGKQVQSVGHKGRNVSYAEQPINSLIAYYNQVRQGCPDALADATLIAIAPLNQPTTTRGAPARFLGKAWV